MRSDRDTTSRRSTDATVATSRRSVSRPSAPNVVTDQPSARWLFRILGAIAAAPIPISAIRNGLSHWYPTRDAALTAIWTTDVFSAHTPLYGLPVSFSRHSGIPYNYLGAVHLYLLAIPVKLLGVSWGLLIAMALLNIGWVALALWLVRRRVGYRVGLLACVVTGLLVWTLGSQVLVDPTPVQTGPLAFFACCAAVWSVADVDPKALVPAAFTAGYLFLTHPQYVFVVPMLVTAAMAVLLVRSWRLRAHDPDRWGELRRPVAHGAIGAAVVTIVLWLPAVTDQLSRPGGNIRAWATSMLREGGTATHGVFDAIRVASSPLIVPPFWFRESIQHEAYGILGPTGKASTEAGALVLVGAVVTATAYAAWRRSDMTTLSGVAVGVVGWLAWTTTVARQPGRAYNYHYLLTSWPLAAFVTMTVVLGAARTRPAHAAFARGTVPRIGAALVAVVVTVFAVATIPIANFRASTPQSNIAPANHIRRAIREHVAPGSPVLVVSNSYPARSYLPVAILELEAMGIEARVPTGWNAKVYRPFRGIDAHHPDPDRRLVITNSPARISSDAELVATGGVPLLEPVETYLTRRRQLLAWADGNTPLEVAADVSMDEFRRTGIDEFLADLEEEPAAKNRTIFDLPATVGRLVDDGPPDLATVLDIPGVTDSQLRSWLQDQRTVLARERYFVFLEPL